MNFDENKNNVLRITNRDGGGGGQGSIKIQTKKEK